MYNLLPFVNLMLLEDTSSESEILKRTTLSDTAETP